MKEFYRVLKKGGIVISIDGQPGFWRTQFADNNFAVHDESVVTFCQHRLSKAEDYGWKLQAYKKFAP